MKENNNDAVIEGEVSEPPVFDHASHEINYYKFYIKISRKSGFFDEIPVKVSYKTVNVDSLEKGTQIKIYGQLQSSIIHENEKRHLCVYIYAKEISFIDLDKREEGIGNNNIYLDGYICKPVVFRKTPLGREIADISMAVNRNNRRSDYIPVIAWEKNARFVASLDVGNHIRVCGRFQSREYKKKLSDTDIEIRTAYELSAYKLFEVEE